MENEKNDQSLLYGASAVYVYGANLYVNLTNQCPNRCDFCLRQNSSGSLYASNLWYQGGEPSKEEFWSLLQRRDLNRYHEIVFCGYGEPTCRADDMLWICDGLRAAVPREKLPPIRLNTNGHGSLINHRNIAPELEGRLDAVSISLNGSNPEEYTRLTRPGSGEKGWTAMLDFTREAARHVPKVMMTIVDYDKTPEEIGACRTLAESLGASFRVRPYG